MMEVPCGLRTRYTSANEASAILEIVVECEGVGGQMSCQVRLRRVLLEVRMSGWGEGGGFGGGGFYGGFGGGWFCSGGFCSRWLCGGFRGGFFRGWRLCLDGGRLCLSRPAPLPVSQAQSCPGSPGPRSVSPRRPEQYHPNHLPFPHLFPHPFHCSPRCQPFPAPSSASRDSAAARQTAAPRPAWSFFCRKCEADRVVTFLVVFGVVGRLVSGLVVGLGSLGVVIEFGLELRLVWPLAGQRYICHVTL